MKKRLLSLMLALIMVFALLPVMQTDAAAATVSADDLISYARQYVGVVPYAVGGRSPSGFDCCGFVWYVCNHFGINVGNGNQRDQINYGTAVSYDKSSYSNVIKNMKKGDLIFFDYKFDDSYNPGSNHVAIYTGDGNIVNAEDGGVLEHTMNQSGWPDGYMWQSICAVRRVISSSTSYLDKCTGYNSYCTLKTTAKTTLKSLPCSASTSSKSKNVATVASGTTLTATKLYKNSAGNYWYKVSYDGKTCYVSGSKATVTAYKNDVKIADAVSPSSIKKGSTFSIGGTVSAKYCKLTKVGGYIFKSGDSKTDSNAVYMKTASASKSYSLKGSAIDSALLFNKLSTGTYDYVIKATVYNYYTKDGKSLSKKTKTTSVVDTSFKITSDYLNKCTGYSSYCTLKTTAKATLKSLPCSEKTSADSKNIATVAAGTTLTATKLYKNSAGNYWYKVSYNGKTGYVYSEYVSVSAFKNDAKISNEVSPTSVKKGSTFSIGGTVSTSKCKLVKVKGYIYKASDEKTNAIYSYTESVSSNSYKLKGSAIDNALLFNKLPKGSYCYRIEAGVKNYYCNDGTTLQSKTSYPCVVNVTFKVT